VAGEDADDEVDASARSARCSDRMNRGGGRERRVGAIAAVFSSHEA
jgi:hypothetical protein